MNARCSVQEALARLKAIKVEEGELLAVILASVALPAPESGYVDQNTSPLGKRAHLQAVRDGRLPGRKVGKKVLVRLEDMNAYVASHPVSKAAVSEPANDIDAEIDAIVSRRGRRTR